jgi:hypothetical protein
VFVAVSAIDSAELAVEAASVIRRLDADPNLRISDLNLPVLDVPEPNWEDVLAAGPDRALLQRNLEHCSIWLVQIAATLLQAVPVDEVG